MAVSRRGADEGAWLQRKLDSGYLKLDARPYLSGRQLQFGNECRIEGVHPSLSVIAAHESFIPPPDKGFVVNREQELQKPQVTRGVRFSNFSIRGSHALRETTVGLGLLGVADSLFVNVSISGFRWCVTPHNSTRLTWDRLECYDWGCAVQPGDAGNIHCEGGTAFLGDTDHQVNSHFTLTHCHFHDGLWTALDTSPDGSAHHWTIISPRIERVMEAGIFGRLTDIYVYDAVIDDVRPRATAAQGFEGGMIDSEWIGGSISNVGGCSILLRGAFGAHIRNVGVFNPYRARVAIDSAIAVEQAQVDGLTIEECYGSDHLSNGAAPIGFYGNGTHNMNNVLVRGRHFNKWSTGNIVREVNDPRGQNFVIED